MKRINNILIIIFSLLVVYACKKEESLMTDLDKLRTNTNKATYPRAKMDSLQAIKSITQQKAQEVLDLSILYSTGNKDTEIDSVMYSQILGYFQKGDSMSLKPLFVELDSLKVRSAKIQNIDVFQKYNETDTLNFAKFEVEYRGENNRWIGKMQREAQYTLVPTPVKFKKEFKFLFISFYDLPKDSTSSGVMR